MAKIHTIESLDQKIDEEIAWRKHELTTSLSIIKSSQGVSNRRASLRAGLLLLYAHWEGWIKEVARLYIRYVNTKSLPYASLSAAFLGNALKTKLDEIGRASTASVHNEFAHFLKSRLGSRSIVSEDLIRTESNLSSRVLFDVIERIGLPKRDIYSSSSAIIDQTLLGERNSIAHGEYSGVDFDEFVDLRYRVLSILEQFTDDVRNAASTDAHKWID